MSEFKDILRGMTLADIDVGVDSGQAGFIPALPEFSPDLNSAGVLKVRPGSHFHAWMVYQGKADRASEDARYVEYYDECFCRLKRIEAQLAKDDCVAWSLSADYERRHMPRKPDEEWERDPHRGRIAMLFITTDYDNSPMAKLERAKYLGSFVCPVDKLMVTDPCYPKSQDDGEPEWWDQYYDRACGATIGDDYPSTIPQGGTFEVLNGVYGVVSSSGYGDGGYSCYYSADEEGYVHTALIDYYIDSSLWRPVEQE